MRIAWNTILWAFLFVVACLTLFPVVITLLGSFKTNAELTAGATFLPAEWQFSNYIEAWEQANFSTYTLNSLFVAGAATAEVLAPMSAESSPAARAMRVSSPWLPKSSVAAKTPVGTTTACR